MQKVIKKMFQKGRGLTQTGTTKGDANGWGIFILVDVQRGFPENLVPATGLEGFGKVRVAASWAEGASADKHQTGLNFRELRGLSLLPEQWELGT